MALVIALPWSGPEPNMAWSQQVPLLGFQHPISDPDGPTRSRGREQCSFVIACWGWNGKLQAECDHCPGGLEAIFGINKRQA